MTVTENLYRLVGDDIHKYSGLMTCMMFAYYHGMFTLMTAVENNTPIDDFVSETESIFEEMLQDLRNSFEAEKLL